jgi:peptidyl-tRNA hydrolase, PTH1 family
LQSDKIIIGLGNHGSSYEGTRHNIGFAVVSSYAEKWGLEWSKDKYAHSLVTQKTINGHRLILAKPLTYMNLSGNAARKLIAKFHVPIENILIVTDDVHLPFGKLRLRGKGSPGGHNGLKHISETLMTSEYARLRIGVGAPDERENLADYVLDVFSPAEKKEIQVIIAAANKTLDNWRIHGILQAMNETNKKTKDLGDKDEATTL